jgi:phosphatidylglycerol lysyltransferase
VAPSSPERAQVRGLVLRHGWNATAYQLLNPGLRYWFDPREEAVVGFVRAPRRPGGAATTWVAAGGPVCRAEAVDAVATRFERQAAAAGARVCWFGADGRLRAARAGRPGYAEMALGAQPVWDPHRWPALLAGKASLRAQRNRALNKGVRAASWTNERAASDPALRRCLREWLGRRGLPPLHFLVEPETLDALGDRRVFVAERAGTPVGFLTLTPVPARRGWLVEQIVRGDGAPNGTGTLLLDAAMRAAAEAGSTYLTLGLSPLSTRAPALPNPLWLRLLLGWLRAHGRRFYNFRGLEAFKAKYLPDRWGPITAITTERRPSPGTLFAVAAAFSGPQPPVALVATALRNALAAEAQALRRRRRP